MKNVLKIIFVIIGALIGAGFISGQEMYQFFYSYGMNGIIGLIICSLLISFIIYKTLSIIVENKINNYKEFLEATNKKSNRKYLNISFITNTIVNIFIFITFCIMIAGFGAYLEQEFKINSIIGSCILAVICWYIFKKNVQGIVKVNGILIPIIILFIGFIGIYNIKTIDFNIIKNNCIVSNNGNFFISSILYCSYNVILLIPVIVTLKDYIKTKKQAKIVSIITAIVVFMLSIIIFSLLARINTDISSIQMPMAFVIAQDFSQFRIIYGIIILMAILTTAVSLGISFLENVSKNKKSYSQIAVIMCISGVVLSKFGFSNLINLLYPIFGVLGLIQIKNIIFK